MAVASRIFRKSEIAQLILAESGLSQDQAHSVKFVSDKHGNFTHILVTGQVPQGIYIGGGSREPVANKETQS